MDQTDEMITDINFVPVQPRPDIYHLEYNPEEV